MRNIIGVACSLLIYSSVLGQNPQLRREIADKHDVSKGKELVRSVSEQATVDKIEVSRYTSKYGLPEKGVYSDGRYYQLRRIEGGNLPIYYSTQNARSRQLTEVNELVRGGTLHVDLQGKDMIIGMWDGQAVFVQHQEFLNGGKSHVILRDNAPRLDHLMNEDLNNAELGKNHATHVAGTLIAKGIDEQAKGLAPEANVWSYDWDNDVVEIAIAAQEGLLVSNHSYGISAIDDDENVLVPPSYFGFYNNDAYQVDRITYLYPYYQPVISAGNDREVYDKINPAKKGNDLLLGNSNSKNAVVVAAVGLNNHNSLEVANFSSFGPTNDFRIKPDIAAPGVKVISTAYQFPRFSNKERNDLYRVSSGTSMAAPAVSAILTLWQQWYIDRFKFPMRSASLRGVMTHTAEYIGDNRPNQKIGWGMINASRGIYLLQNVSEEHAILKESILFNNKEFKYRFKLKEQSDRLLLTLSWTDAEGVFNKEEMQEDNTTKKLINDLDIRVFKDGVEYMPWYLNQDFYNLEAFKGDNTVDNLERIEIAKAEVGEYEVVVSHKGVLKYGRQDFSLLISNNELKGIESISNTVGLDPEDIIVWPNPVESVVNLEIKKDKVFKISNIEIFDLSNRLVKKVRVSATNRAIIDMSDLSKGVYLFYIEVGGERVRTKVVKK